MGRLQYKNQEKIEYTEETIQSELEHFFSPSSVKYSLDGLYVFNWESDKLIEMRSGLIYEFEIKISKADFKNDFKKVDKHVILEGDYKNHKIIPKGEKIIKETEERSRNNSYYGNYNVVEATKKNIYNNEYYLVENHKRPNFFYYVVPKDLIEVDEVPSYAGLIYIDNEIKYGSKFIIKKKAPQLHKVKYTDEELNLVEKFYYNMDNWKRKYRSLSKDTEMYKKQLKEETNKSGHEIPYYTLKEMYDASFKTISDLTRDLSNEQNKVYKLNYDCSYNNTVIKKQTAAAF